MRTLTNTALNNRNRLEKNKLLTWKYKRLIVDVGFGGNKNLVSLKAKTKEYEQEFHKLQSQQ